MKDVAIADLPYCSAAKKGQTCLYRTEYRLYVCSPPVSRCMVEGRTNDDSCNGNYVEHPAHREDNQ